MDKNSVVLLNAPNHILKPREPQAGIQAALQHDLRCPEFNGFSHFFKYRIRAELVGIRGVFVAVKSAEPAFTRTDIGIVDIAVDKKCRQIGGMQARCPHLGKLPELQKARFEQQP